VGATLEEQVADALELMLALGVHPSQHDEDGPTDCPDPMFNIARRLQAT
jgi:hypothetical protein